MYMKVMYADRHLTCLVLQLLVFLTVSVARELEPHDLTRVPQHLHCLLVGEASQVLTVNLFKQ